MPNRPTRWGTTQPTPLNVEAGADIVELSEGVGHEVLLLGSAGDEGMEEGLDVFGLGLVVGIYGEEEEVGEAATVFREDRDNKK